MRQPRQLNWADLNGLLAVAVGVLGGAAGSAARGAGWPLVTLFAACGCALGVTCAKSIGRLAYACLNRADLGALSAVGYALIPPAMPLLSGVLAYAIPAAALGARAAT